MTSTYFGEEEMLTVLETLALSDDAMFVIDDRHRIVFWNHGMHALLGYTHDEVAGRSCCSALAGTDAFGNRYCSEACPVLTLAARREPIRPYRLGYRAKTGTFIPLDVSILRMTLRASKRLLLVHMCRPAEDYRAPIADAPHLPHSDARVHGLTPRETDILTRLARGQSAATLASELGISPLTARNHIQHMFEKLEVHSRSEAVAFAFRVGLA